MFLKAINKFIKSKLSVKGHRSKNNLVPNSSAEFLIVTQRNYLEIKKSYKSAHIDLFSNITCAFVIHFELYVINNCE